MNTLIVIGQTGSRIAYLNISREEAIDRFLKSYPYFQNESELARLVDEFSFEDEFDVYDVYAPKKH